MPTYDDLYRRALAASGNVFELREKNASAYDIWVGSQLVGGIVLGKIVVGDGKSEPRWKAIVDGHSMGAWKTWDGAAKVVVSQKLQIANPTFTGDVPGGPKRASAAPTVGKPATRTIRLEFYECEHGGDLDHYQRDIVASGGVVKASGHRNEGGGGDDEEDIFGVCWFELEVGPDFSERFKRTAAYEFLN